MTKKYNNFSLILKGSGGMGNLEGVEPSSPETATKKDPLTRAKKVIQNRLNALGESSKELFRKSALNRALPLTLLSGLVLFGSGCANSPRLPGLPFLQPQATATVPRTEEAPLFEASPTPSPQDRLKYKDQLPKDVVSTEQLQQEFNTRIWNTPSVELFLRRQALDSEPILKDMKKAQTEKLTIPWISPGNPDYRIEVNTSLDVVLIDNQTVRSRFMSQEQKTKLPGLYAQLRADENQRFLATKNQIEQNRAKYLPYYDQRIAEYKAEIEAKKDTPEAERIKVILADVEKIKKSYTVDLSKYDYDRFYDEFGFIDRHAAGMYIDGSLELIDINQDPPKYAIRYYILLAVQDYHIDPEHSFPKSENFTLTGTNPLYPVDSLPGEWAGFALRHEFAHHTSVHPKTDLIALAGLQKAYQAFQEGDDSFYYMFFRSRRGGVATRRKPKIIRA